MTLGLPEYLESKISPEPNSGCWLWLASLDKDGYGLAHTPTRKGKTVRAHRAVFECVNGKIPVGLTLDHGCRVRCCVNPEHQEPVTNVVNIMRGEGVCAKNARMTHCKNGHPLDGARINKSGERICRACQKEYMHTYRKGKL